MAVALFRATSRRTRRRGGRAIGAAAMAWPRSQATEVMIGRRGEVALAGLSFD